MPAAQAAKEKMHAPVFSLAASAAAAATTKSAGTNPIPQPDAWPSEQHVFFKTNPISQLAQNSRLGHQLPTAVLYQSIGPAISNTATGFHHPVYDSRVRPRCTGKERDSETGLDYFGPRYMSSAQGRFTSPDAIFFQASMLTDPQRFNLYAYVGNNPLRYVDPTGEAIELLGDEEQRKKALEALKQAVGDKAGQYLKIGEKKGWFGLGKTHYVVAVSDQKAFANSNAVAGELNPIIQDSRTITVGFVGSGATVALDSGQRVALNPTTTDAMGNPVGTPAVSGLISGSVGTRMIDPSQPLGIFPGILMSNGQPSPLDPGLTLAHELGHDWAILTHDFRTVLGNPYNTDAAALRLENKVRELRDPSGAQRLFHNPPGR